MKLFGGGALSRKMLKWRGKGPEKETGRRVEDMVIQVLAFAP